MSLQDAKQLIIDAKNICILPSQTNEPESLTSTLALFYTLKELNKNVNLIIEELPENLNFLTPSLDFITTPKNFVISIPKTTADVSQIYYEKNEENLKIHLTVDRGRIKKENISFYISNVKPDLVITLGIQDFQKQLETKLDSFGFMLGVPILNIDSEPFDAAQGKNKKFGQINLIGDKSISELVLDVIKSIDENLIKKNTADCLLAGLVIHYENFKSKNMKPEIFKISAELLNQGASHGEILNNLQKATRHEISFLTRILQNLKNEENSNVSVAMLGSDDFENFGELEAAAAIEKIKTIGIQSDLLVLWKSHASEPAIKGFFNSKNQDLLNKIAKDKQNSLKNGWAFISMPMQDINLAKDQILKLL